MRNIYLKYRDWQVVMISWNVAFRPEKLDCIMLSKSGTGGTDKDTFFTRKEAKEIKDRMTKEMGITPKLFEVKSEEIE